MQLPAKSKRQNAGNPALLEHLRETIRRDGPVTFAWFMEQALYHPLAGYYSSGRCTIGRGGDYFTSVSVGPLFGRLLAAQFAEMWTVLGQTVDFTIVEQGAHDGVFARDVLETVQRRHPDLFDALRYEIVEPFPILRGRQSEMLSAFHERVGWHQSLTDLPLFCGVHFSNELIDAMPVHVLRWTGAEWQERYVTEQEGDFAFIELPLSTPALVERLREVPMPLPAGYETEVNLAALDWITRVSQTLLAGFILAADYGFSRDEFYAPHRTAGTLRSYAKHRVVPSPLTDPGQVDITTHVDWTSLAARAESEGLSVLGFADQHHFITGLLAGDVGQEFGAASDAKTRRALQTLLHPDFLGRNFQLLALGKNLDQTPTLTGFRFARGARVALGLR